MNMDVNTMRMMLNNPQLNPQQRALLSQLIDNIEKKEKLEAEEMKLEEEEEEKGSASIAFEWIDKDKLEEEFVKYFTAREKGGSGEKPNVVAELVLSEAFGRTDYSLFLDQVYKGKPVKTGLCRKLLKNRTDVGYQCLDCQKDPTCIICSGCFEKSNHKGHRIFLKQNVSGMCDCGDKDAWDPRGNCSDHTGFVEEDNYLESQYKERLIKCIKKAFYFIFQAVEKYRKKSARAPASDLIVAVLDLLMELSETYPSLTPVVSRAIYSDITYSEKGEVKMHHDPSNLDGTTKTLEKAFTIKSSVLSLILRYSLRFVEEAQRRMSKFLVSVFVDYEFKKVFAVEFINYFNFYFDLLTVRTGRTMVCSPIIELAIQILTSEELAAIAIQKADMEYFLRSITTLMSRYVRNKEFEAEAPIVKHHLYGTLFYCLMKRQGVEEFFSRPKLVEALFDNLKVLHCHRVRFAKEARVENFERLSKVSISQIDVEEYLIDEHLNICGVLATCSNEVRMKVFPSILKTLKKLIIDTTEKENSEAGSGEQLRSMNILLQRVFVVYLIGACYFQVKGGKTAMSDLNVDTYISLMKQVFANEEERELFWSLMTQILARVSGFMREISCKCWNNYSTVLVDLKGIYYSLDCFYVDTIGLQFCNLELKPDAFFTIFFRNFLHIKGAKWMEQVLEKAGKEMNNLVADLFSSLTEISTNEFLLPNLLHRVESYVNELYGSEYIEGSKFYTEPTMNFLRQFLGAYAPMKIKDFRETVKKFVSDQDLTNEFVGQSADFDKHTQIIKAKPAVVEKLKKSGLSSDLLWFDSSESAKYSQEAKEKFPLNDELYTPETSTMLVQRIKGKLFCVKSLDKMMEVMRDLESNAQNKGPWQNLLKSFFKLILVHLSAYKPSPQDESSLRSFFDNTLENLLKTIESKQEQTSWAVTARERFNEIKKRYLKDQMTVSNAASQESVKKEEERRRQVMNEKFHARKEKVMKKMERLKSEFMSKLSKTSLKIADMITQTSTDACCPVTQEKLVPTKTSFVLAFAHPDTPLGWAQICTLNSLLENTPDHFPKNKYNAIEIVRDAALAELKKPASVIIASCGHQVSSPDVLAKDATVQTNVYQDDEYGCPVCKTPGNMVVPIYQQGVFAALTNPPASFSTGLPDLGLRDLLSSIEDILKGGKGLEKFTDGSCFTKEGREAIAGESLNVSQASSMITTFSILFGDLFERATKRKLRNIPQADVVLTASLGEVLSYSEIYGLPNSAQRFGQVYHNLYLTSKLNFLQENLEGEGLDAKNEDGFTKRMVLAMRVAGAILACNTFSPYFMDADIEKAFASAVSDCVDFRLTADVLVLQ
jgi:hypothetical protein